MCLALIPAPTAVSNNREGLQSPSVCIRVVNGNPRSICISLGHAKLANGILTAFSSRGLS